MAEGNSPLRTQSTNNTNAGSFGPITINAGVTVTVGAGESWTVI